MTSRNPYVLYVEEKDPRDTYEVVVDMTHSLAVMFMFKVEPNYQYWQRVIIPELKHMAAERRQCIMIDRNIHDTPLCITILPPGKQPRDSTLLRRRGW